MKLRIIAPFLLLLAFSCATPQKALKGKSDTAEKKSDKDKVEIKPYDKVITKEAKTDDGLFKVHIIKEDFFYEIPDSLFGREMLMVTRIAKTATNIGFGGGKTNTQVLRWEKKPTKVLLRVVSHQIFAADSLPIHEAVMNSNFEPVLFLLILELLVRTAFQPSFK